MGGRKLASGVLDEQPVGDVCGWFMPPPKHNWKTHRFRGELGKKMEHFLRTPPPPVFFQ